MGAIADEFCRRPGTILGTGLHRVCAWGREAELHSRGYAHLLAIDGWALLIGVDIHRCSSMHAAESSVGLPDAIRRRFEVPQDIRQDYPESDWYIQYGEAPRDAWGQIQAEAERPGLIKQGRIGRAACRLFRARAVVGMYAEALRADPLGLFGVEE
jgi:aminoglycoside N3'-acetyltransferase